MKIVFSPEAIAMAEAIDVWKIELENARKYIKDLQHEITVLQTLTIAQGQRIGNAIITLQDASANDDKQGLIYSLILSAIRMLEGRA